MEKGLRDGLEEGLIPDKVTTIKLKVGTWNLLRDLKKKDETFDDIIKELLNQRTKEIEEGNFKAIKFKRKTLFFVWDTSYLGKVGFECEYNDIKNKFDFSLDLAIKKIFQGKKIMNPSEFFGVDNEHKYLSRIFLIAYLRAIAIVLQKELKISFATLNSYRNIEDIVLWRQFYYDFKLSEESFTEDIELPLKMGEDKDISREFQGRVGKSPSQKIILPY